MSISDFKTREDIIKKRKYRQNILGDKFSLYISSYPTVIKHLANRIGDRNEILVELCCGIGVTLEIITPYFKKTIGIDIDKNVVDNCKKNIENIGLKEYATIIQGNILDESLLKTINADIAIYDIPYWSPYDESQITISSKQNPDLKEVIDKIKKNITDKIIIFASPNFDYSYIHKQLGYCEYEKIYINTMYDRNIIYLGKLTKKNGVIETQLNH